MDYGLSSMTNKKSNEKKNSSRKLEDEPGL